MSKKSQAISTVHQNLAGIRDDVQAMNAALAEARPLIQQITTLLNTVAMMKADEKATKDTVN